MMIRAKGLMAASWRNRRGTFFLCFLFTFFEILDGIFARPDGGRYRADNEQRHDDHTPNPLSAILLHQPKKKGDEGYGKDQNKKPAGDGKSTHLNSRQ